MNLRKWASNSAALRDVFTQPDRSNAISVLGVLWDQYEDKIKIKPLEWPMNDTLRTVLSTSAQFYDPVGWFSPIMLTAKHFLREIHSTYAWDDPLTDEHREQWYAIRTELQRATEQRQDRFQTSITDDAATYTLHVFTDASIKTCACAIYLRKEKQNDVKSYLLLSKTKLAKLRNIPKLELIAVLLGIKALEYVRQAIRSNMAAFLWCDSKCALSWLSSQRILPLFIERQVEIINAAPQLEKRYVPSALNIADLPSRGSDFACHTHEWFSGPDWLNSSTDSWPQAIPLPKLLEELLPEEDLKTTAVASTAQKFLLDINPAKYSNILTLLRVTTYVLKFLSKFSVVQRRKLFPNPTLFTTQRLWIQNEQSTHLCDIIEAIDAGKYHRDVAKFNLYVDIKGIIRCAGRFQHAPLSADERKPIFLPSPHASRFVWLLVEHYHVTSFHSGLHYVLTSFRRRYWIPAGSRIFYNIIRKCAKCKRYITRPLRQPQESQLPPFRLEEATPPFRRIGLDMFGPLHVNSEKRWVLLVTDLVIRAVDLELLEDMSSDQIFVALRTIIARHSTPILIVSDQAPQFEAVNEALQQYYTHEWKWKFLPAHSPWMGGVYERMVKLVKDAIQRTFHNAGVTNYVLRATLAKIAATLNARPLTAVTNAQQDPEPLTPNHFLHSYYHEENEAKLAESTKDKTPTVHQLITIARCCKANLDRFWVEWRTTYLQFLREKGFYRNALFSQRPSVTHPQVNAIVLVSEKLQKRSKWRLGRVVKLITSSDGQVRAAKVRTEHGIISRPLCELYPLEITDDIVPDENLAAERELLAPEDDWDNPEISVQIFEDDSAE